MAREVPSGPICCAAAALSYRVVKRREIQIQWTSLLHKRVNHNNQVTYDVTEIAIGRSPRRGQLGISTREAILIRALTNKLSE